MCIRDRDMRDRMLYEKNNLLFNIVLNGVEMAMGASRGIRNWKTGHKSTQDKSMRRMTTGSSKENICSWNNGCLLYTSRCV